MQDRTTVRLPSDLLLSAKRVAAAQGRTLTSLIEDGLRLVIKNPTEPSARRITLLVSRAKGGLLPGVDLADRDILESEEDLAYVAGTMRQE